MAAGAINVYDFATKYLMNGTVDLDTATIKIALCSSSMTVDLVNHDTWADVSANEISGVNGYTTGGATLTNPVFTAITNGYRFETDDVTWDATGGSIAAWRYAVFYASGTYNSVVNPIIAYFVGDSTPADIPATTEGNSLQIRCPTDGWFDMVRA